EVEPDPRAVELDRVLLRGGEAVAVRGAHEAAAVGDGVRAVERGARVAGPGVEVVVLDGLEALGGAAAQALLHVPDSAGALRARGDVDRELARPAWILESP